MHSSKEFLCISPFILTAEAQNESVLLKWGSVQGADGYRVYMYDFDKRQYIAIKYTSEPEKTVYALTNNIEYRFKVKAFRLENGSEVYSNFSESVSCIPVPKGFMTAESVLMLNKLQTYSISCTYDGVPSNKVEYASTDEGIVTINNLGMLTAVSRGEATVTAYSPVYDQSAEIRVIVDREAPQPALPIDESRFIYKDGLYVNPSGNNSQSASIIFTGDMMCVSNQQKKALKDGGYNFYDSFRLIRPVISNSDFAIGTLETMLSESHPYAIEKLKVDGKPNCNAPPNFLDGVRYAGFDAVVTATNHSCDTELSGIRETLSHIKRYNLMNLGIHERYFIVDINGIKTAFFSYTMVTNNRDGFLDDHQKELILCHYARNTFENDYESAKKAGAEFSIVMIHWGIMNSTMVRERQITAAKEIADIGADYIIGSHPHVLQKADIIISADGRDVPIVYSLGNLISSMREMTENSNTIILRLNLEKTSQGVRICSSQYIPCVILFQYLNSNYVTAPVLPEFCGYEETNLIQMLQRIHAIKDFANNKIQMVNIGDCIFKKLAAIAPEALFFKAFCIRNMGFLSLEWEQIEGADGYRIYGQSGNGGFLGICNSVTNHAEISFKENDTTAFKIKAFKIVNGKKDFFRTSIVLYPNRSGEQQEHPLISFIVPEYNDEKYLERLFDSILSNTIINCEVIVINDGSTDNSQEIIDKYCEKFPQVFRSLIKENGGVSKARNAGIAAARGKYIGFIDSDDSILPETCELLEKAAQTDSDIIISAYYKYKKSQEIVIQGKLPFEEYIKLDIDLYLALLYGKGFAGQAAIWNKLYRAELIKDKPNPSMMTEDVAWSPYIASYAESFSYIATPFYEYRRREGSTSDIINIVNQNEIFERRMNSIQYFLENGNPQRKHRLYEIAEKRLEWHMKNTTDNSFYARELKRLKLEHTTMKNNTPKCL